MPARFFDAFPKTTYEGFNVTDITARVKILDKVRGNHYAFYPYDVKEGQRADQIADDYYNDPFYSWLIYYANDVVDPYYDWHMDDDDFQKFIVSKYGSPEQAHRQIMFYRTNWEDDHSVIPTNVYDAYPDNIRRYWVPIYGPNYVITSYERSKQDLIASTNRIVSLSITSNTVFQINENVSFRLGNTVVGTAQVASSNDSILTVQHVAGLTDRLVRFNHSGIATTPFTSNATVVLANTSANVANAIVSSSTPTYTILVLEDTVPTDVATITDQSSLSIPVNSTAIMSYVHSDFGTANDTFFANTNLLVQNIDISEEVYYFPISAYDVEEEKNGNKASIQILDSSFASQAWGELKKLMKE